jgi:hypothetical protein
MEIQELPVVDLPEGDPIARLEDQESELEEVACHASCL